MAWQLQLQKLKTLAHWGPQQQDFLSANSQMVMSIFKSQMCIPRVLRVLLCPVFFVYIYVLYMGDVLFYNLIRLIFWKFVGNVFIRCLVKRKMTSLISAW